MNQNYELVHYGVKGMKWGVRKAEKEYAKLDKAKVDYEKAKKAYNKSFNKAYNRSIAAYSPVKKHRDANDKRWKDAANKAEELESAKKAYKDQKKSVRKNTTVGQKIGRGLKKVGPTLGKIGTSYVYDQTFNAGRGTKAAKAFIQVAGMTAITAYTAARGGTDIHWYDKQGRKIV